MSPPHPLTPDLPTPSELAFIIDLARRSANGSAPNNARFWPMWRPGFEQRRRGGHDCHSDRPARLFSEREATAELGVSLDTLRREGRRGELATASSLDGLDIRTVT